MDNNDPKERNTKTVKVYWYNDKTVPVNVAVHTLGKYTHMHPQTLHAFDVEVREGCAILIKEWDYDKILISDFPIQKDKNEKSD